MYIHRLLDLHFGAFPHSLVYYRAVHAQIKTESTRIAYNIPVVTKVNGGGGVVLIMFVAYLLFTPPSLLLPSPGHEAFELRS